ncbi:metallophosphoesterase [Mucilaginibacter rubeus]|uniref:Metallophosphoesterase n=1 Tax=Mucilaginibacter rubeus TaxID=2027860 RepID=A0AAE6MIW7_9SPHI|nr:MULTISPECIES: metallophosphoesterase [Mucilaginibacter]QEM04639.1 metallophosphoesterase [Mucilaginibacter rubeus]QEM17232.1 metallophosphoesterase [Mucilaginibacter gossypii]QTE46262.1 metallophosphoesterase [Mucilaginibacter rubeus]QTE52859.1 metallophosphoesterase [Mucilaginibacter rubeus]QTE57945.1 metallophosphoesterase [Mucilaginibacter rubeus]
MHSSGFLKVFAIIALISLLFDWYIHSGLKTLTADWQSNLWRNVVLWGYLITSVGVTALFLIGFGAFSTASGMRPFHEWMLSLFLTFFITKLVFIIVLSLGDLGRFFVGVFNLISGSGRVAGQPAFPGRRKFISEIAVLAAAVPFTSFFYAMLKGKYDYKLHKTTLYFDDLPDAFDGFTITQLSDIHSGSFDNTEAMQSGIDLAKAQKSDLFVFTGDLVNNAASEIEPYIERFGQIKAPYGQFSILGNHDYGDYIHWDNMQEKAANLDKLKQHHKALGYRLLLDENVTIEKGGQSISLIGIQNWGRGFIQIGDLNKALQDVPRDAFKILLSHDPTHWEEQVRYNPTTIHLTLSGHTHGAQFGVEIPGFRWSPVKYRYVDWAGLASEKNRYLYVNRGFGFLAFSGRLGIWPEVTVIELKKKVV